MTQLLSASWAAASIGPPVIGPRSGLSMLLAIAICAIAARADEAAPAKPYRVVHGRADDHTYNGFRRYHAGCNHCPGPDGLGSSFGPSLIEALPSVGVFRDVVLNGRRNVNSVMKGFAGDGNVAPCIEDLYVYLQARSDGTLGRGRPPRLD